MISLVSLLIVADCSGVRQTVLVFSKGVLPTNEFVRRLSRGTGTRTLAKSWSETLGSGLAWFVYYWQFVCSVLKFVLLGLGLGLE